MLGSKFFDIPSYPFPSGTAAHFNTVVLRTAKTLWSFGRSERNRVKAFKMVRIHYATMFVHLCSGLHSAVDRASPATYFSGIPFTDSRKAVVSYWGKYGHLVLVNHIGGLSLPRNSVVRLTSLSRHDYSCLSWT